MPLSAATAQHAKSRERAYKLSDGQGLYLLVNPNGSRYWRLKYRFTGREKTLALGVYPEVSLAEARAGRDDARRLIRKGLDPMAIRRTEKVAKRKVSANSFKVIATEWFNAKMGDKSEGHRKRTWRALEKDLFPSLGSSPIASIKPKELLQALRKIEDRGAVETARRANQTCGQIYRYAVATGRADTNPSTELWDAFQATTKKHLAAITEPREVGKLMIAIEGFEGTPVVKAALKLSPLFFCRPGELRHMAWIEIDWEQKQWVIPEEKMKTRQSHIVPLCAQAITVLKELQCLTGRGKFVFPSARGADRPLSDNGVRTALRSLGYDNGTMTPHGFRAMARTLLDEVLNCRVDYIEHQLAHMVKDANGRAYNRTKHLEERQIMMQNWADYLDILKNEASDFSVQVHQFKQAKTLVMHGPDSGILTNSVTEKR